MEKNTSVSRTFLLLAAQFPHAGLLLIPTVLLSGFAGIGLSTTCFVICVAAAAFMESLYVSHCDDVRKCSVQDNFSMRIATLVGVSLLLLFWMAQVERIFAAAEQTVIQIAGALSMLAGATMRVAAIRALGAGFVSDIRVGNTIVRDGIYRWMRHPSEIGLLLIGIGGPLLLGSVRTTAIAIIVLVPISVWRIRREDNAIACSVATVQ